MSNFMNRSVDLSRFAMVPRADVPRSLFKMEFQHKTTFNAGVLIPVMCEEVLPGDSWSVDMAAFGRLATPLFPLMDNLHLDSFFFFVPNRLVWTNWVRFMGEKPEPSSSIDFMVPQIQSPAGGFPVGSLYDYLGLPTVGQVAVGSTILVNALPLRAYSLVWNEWFRDQNLQSPAVVDKGDSSSAYDQYVLRRRGKRGDYFTSCLPWPQKGNPVGLTGSGPIAVFTRDVAARTGPNPSVEFRNSSDGSNPTYGRFCLLCGRLVLLRCRISFLRPLVIVRDIF